jgi:CHASE3 domain sensor protein
MDFIILSNLFFLGSLIFVGVNVIVLYLIRKRLNEAYTQVNKKM